MDPIAKLIIANLVNLIWWALLSGNKKFYVNWMEFHFSVKSLEFIIFLEFGLVLQQQKILFMN